MRRLTLLVFALCFAPLTAAAMDMAVKHQLDHWLHLLPPRYLFIGGVGGLLLGYLLYRGGSRAWLHGPLIVAGVTSLFLWVAAMFISTFFLVTTHERTHPSGGAASVRQYANDCRGDVNCPAGDVCATIGHHHRCRRPCSRQRPCPGDELCVITASGPSVCLERRR